VGEVGDAAVDVAVAGGSDPARAEGEGEEFLDLTGVELGGALGHAPGDAAGVGLREVLDERLKDDPSVAIEREDRRLAGGEIDRDKAAAFIHPEDNVGRAGRVFDARLGRAWRWGGHRGWGRGRAGGAAGGGDKGERDGGEGQSDLRHAAPDADPARPVPEGSRGADRHRSGGDVTRAEALACESRVRFVTDLRISDTPLLDAASILPVRVSVPGPRIDTRALPSCQRERRPNPVSGVEADRPGDDATGGSGEGVLGPYADLPRLLGGVHLLRRR